MSEAEALVRAGYDAFNAGERDPRADWWHADAVYVTAQEDPDAGVREGFDAVTAQFRRWVEAYPDLRVEAQDVREGDRAVFAWVRFSGHGAGSGVPMEMELAHILYVDGGRIRRLEEYFDRDEALAAAGLAK